MSQYLVVDGDKLEFSQNFGVNSVTPTGVCQINGSGEATILGKKICILGNEKLVSVAATYYSAAYPTAGTGSITIATLGADQQASFATAETPVIVVGSQFTARFTVISPATSANGTPDSTPVSMGTGKFINSQNFVTAG